jgi:fructoselysine 6-phosphate deglycase
MEDIMPSPTVDPDVASALSQIAGRKVDHVFFVACGGSLSIMHPAKFMLDQQSRTLPSDVYNAAEFTHRAPRRLTADSLVILCSMTGTTRETVAAAEFARQAGAFTVGMSTEAGSPLAQSCDCVVGFEAPYTTGVPIDAKDSNYARIYQLVLGLAKTFDGSDKLDALMESLGSLQPAIDRAHAVFAPLFDDYAPRFAKEQVIYTMASGASYGAAYSFAICVLMEMQWIDSQAIHANEFFHGPFEVLDESKAFILLKGLDSTRPLEARAETFLRRFGDAKNILVLDAQSLDLEGIAPDLRGNLVPLIFFDTLWRFAYKLAELRDHTMLEGRRYMKKLADY